MSASTQGELLIKLISLHNRIQKQLAGQLSFHGISVTEYLVLRQLHQAADRKMRRIDLAQQVGLSSSGVTRLLNPMQKVGLICKEEVARDARISLVALTAAGETIFLEATASFDQVAKSLLAPIGGKDQSKLLKIAGSLL